MLDVTPHANPKLWLARSELFSGFSALSALSAVWMAFALSSSAQAQIGGCTPDTSDPIVVVLETPVGDLPIALYPNMAPLTVANFLAYADRGDYDGSLVHRSVPGFVIQGGGYREEGGGYAAIPTDPPVTNEPCLSNTAGTVAMARVGGQPNSATNQWFINLTDNTNLDSVDGGFTAFGRVVGDGMDVALAIAGLPRFDTLAYLELPFNHIFSDFPLFALPEDPPGGYGCSRASPVFGLFAENGSGFVVDPLRSGSLFVPVLLDPQCTGSGATGPPVQPCNPANGREVYEIDLDQQIFFQPPLAMSCDAVAESEESWAARRAGTVAQLLEDDVRVTTVPEPGSAWMLLAGATALGALAGRRRCR